ncbi:Cysteine-rich receptor-like protein kinase 10 [Dichanthelium oligosanthes]|uniref:non-specific serine/threonine protein kinase n=1 Tax=Dichanthelium oligosanthes TaxID=888268 RepID=A0A1E5UXH2_9POAL|nr:Cysteine-rich receptor-like protein kinase 10 [Dichanthelium oligosanthes]
MLVRRYATLATIVVALAVLPGAGAAAVQNPSCDDNGGTYAANGTFQANLNSLALSLPANASASPAGFATGTTGAAPDQIYALALCRGDTNASVCGACVVGAFRDGQRACPLNKGVTVYRDACLLRFSGARILDFLKPDQWLYSELMRRIKVTKNHHPLKKIGRAQCMIFDLPTLQEATENFSEKNKLGEGGFGTVYKGTLSDGQEIAVKKLLGMTGHGLSQLHNEVLVLAELQHKNLVRYVDHFATEDASGENPLKWDQQYNIILGIAKGILYLHEDSSMRIIHRDLKANNILLDDDMEPKIADFGLARLLGEGHTHTRTTRVVGTLGYMAPEYAMDGSVSPKIDIFSFGVLVLEIVARRRNCSSDDHSSVNLISDVWDHWTKGEPRPPRPRAPSQCLHLSGWLRHRLCRTAPDQASGLALCRGDINASACVAAAFQDAQWACPLQKGVAVFRDACVLRFASFQFLDVLREDQWLVSELV